MIEHIPSDLDISRVNNIGFYKFLKKIGFRELIKRWSVLSISCFHKNIQVKWPEDHKDAPLLKIGCVYLVFILRNDRKTKKYKTRHRETQERFSFYILSLFFALYFSKFPTKVTKQLWISKDLQIRLFWKDASRRSHHILY